MTLEEFLKEWHSTSPVLLVHTSGSTGQPKPLLVEKRRMEASARITCQFLGLREGDTALLCMPLDYIAGKMMVVRALACGLRLVSVVPSGHPLASVTQPIAFAAMVPLQVYNSLQVPEERERLRQIRHLLIGGGAIDDAMAEVLKDFPHAVWSTYGMTETLSHIALRRLSGSTRSDWYTPLAGVTVSLGDGDCLVVDAPAVHDGILVTNDVAELSPVGGQSFRILGRKDNVVCSGGVKIQIEEVEQRLRPVLAAPFMATKRRDPKFGEALVLLTEGSPDEARSACAAVLPRLWLPRHYMHVDRLPVTATGKPARYLAQEIAEKE